DAAVPAKLAVVIGGPFPDAQRSEVLGLERRSLPLVHRIVGDAGEADLAVRPQLRPGPFDAGREILRLARRPRVEKTRRSAGAARVDPHAYVAVRHPTLGIDQLPVLIFVGRALLDLGTGLDDPQPGMFVAFLETAALGVGTVAQDHGKFAGSDGT